MSTDEVRDENEARVCRLCDENNDNLHNIFDYNGSVTPIINIIKHCLPMPVYKTDPLSKYVCPSCKDNLQMFYDFKKNCMEVAKKHREDLQTNASNDPDVLMFLKQWDDKESLENGEYACEINGNNEESQFSSSLPSNANDYMDYCSSANEERSDTNITFGSLITQKPRISGPKSITNLYVKHMEAEEIVYQPLTLLELIVNDINTRNLPDYEVQPWQEEVQIVEKVHYCCRYCDETFEEEQKLAIHELDTHIRLNLLKVDKEGAWVANSEEKKLRNKWLRMEGSGSAEFLEENDTNDSMNDAGTSEENALLVPMPEKGSEDNSFDVSRNSVVYFVNEVPYYNGQPLKDCPKLERYKFYKAVRMFGARKKFCQLCRYTFKDNWSVDCHYFTHICYYSCNYCGTKFKRNKDEYPAHLKAHEDAGDQKSLSVFVSNDRGDVREYDISCLEPYIPQVHQTPPKPKVIPKPTPMTLRVRQIKQEPVEEQLPPSPPPALKSQQSQSQTQGQLKVLTTKDLAKNQAYFCKNCYQVFTKLDSYNSHIKNCNGEIDDPEMSLIRHYNKKDGSSPSFCSKVKPQQFQQRKILPKKEPPPLRPINSQFPQIKVKDEFIEMEAKRSAQAAPGNFPCNFCSAVFFTVYSRNSHMRIHTKQKNAKSQSKMVSLSVKRQNESPSVNDPNKRFKQNSYEPIVEIHEMSNNIGSVSITPLKRGSNGVGLNVSPDILKLVQNNPNISLKPRAPENKQQQSRQLDPTPQNRKSTVGGVARYSPCSGDEQDPSKTYKCASCNKPFPNKSSLYFHKKNNCTGSRYPCPFCKKRFGTASEYSSHIFYAHPE